MAKEANPGQLMLEMLSTLHVIDARIDENVRLLRENFIVEERKPEVREKVIRLIDTRFCIMHSLMDLRERIVKMFSDDISAEFRRALEFTEFYKSIRRELRDVK
jgi:hypothetical protein